jgi:hypothetical protein
MIDIIFKRAFSKISVTHVHIDILEEKRNSFDNFCYSLSSLFGSFKKIYDFFLVTSVSPGKIDNFDLNCIRSEPTPRLQE